MIQEIITYVIIFAAVASVLIRWLKFIKRSKKKNAACPAGCSLDCSTCPFAGQAAYHYKNAKSDFQPVSPTHADKNHTVGVKTLHF